VLQVLAHVAFALAFLQAAALAVLAQSTVDPNVLSIVGNGVTVIILAWYVVYDVRVRTPSMVTAFQKEMAEQRNAFTKDQTETHLHYNLIIEKIRETFVAEQTQTRTLFTSEQVATRHTYDSELAELRKMLLDNLVGMRTAVHDVKNTAQTLMNKSTEMAHQRKSEQA
jgi:hypothetical protein